MWPAFLARKIWGSGPRANGEEVGGMEGEGEGESNDRVLCGPVRPASSRMSSLETSSEDLDTSGLETSSGKSLRSPSGLPFVAADTEEDELHARESARAREMEVLSARIRRGTSVGQNLSSTEFDIPATGVRTRSKSRESLGSPLLTPKMNDELKEIFVPNIPVHVDGDTKESIEALDKFRRVDIKGLEEETSPEVKQVCRRLMTATELREKYQSGGSVAGPGRIPYWGGIDKEKFNEAHWREAEKVNAQDQSLYRRRVDPPFEPFPESREDSIWTSRDHKQTDSNEISWEWQGGVVNLSGRMSKDLHKPPPAQEFYNDLFELVGTAHDAACKSICFRRLQLLESLFRMHLSLNSEKENEVQKAVPHRDFYNVRKVDTHIHHSAIMNQKHLLRFIKSKLKRSSHEEVTRRDGKLLTLAEVFRSLKLTAYDLSIDTLDMHADNTFHRFDRFNLKYNPIGESRLREVFLKTDNFRNGQYLAEITKEVIKDAEANKYVMMEPRVSIYGRDIKEWGKLGRWYCSFQVASPNIRWMIQIPRLYSVYKSSGLVENFQDMLTNIFQPLFEVTLDPSSNVVLDNFLNQVTGFDCVDDESRLDRHSLSEMPIPENWDGPENPPYSYWIYHIYANLVVLNGLRRKLHLTEFSFRPHAGEAGDMNNLAATFLCAHGINHGILLRKSPTLQYLYYLMQIGMALSPTSNCKLFLDYQSNPFPSFFAKGLNVSLSTDDPLLLHITKEPLVEEYSIASQIWRFSSTDMCEIARNSVLQSGYEHPYKAHFLGSEYVNVDGPKCGNNITHTNVPNIRVIYRKERLEAEWKFLKNNSSI